MSGMNFLEKLLDGVAVEWKAMGDISLKISSGGTPQTGVAEYYGGDIPWLRTQEVNFGDIWDTGVKITKAGLNNSSANWIPENCVIVAMYGATVGKIGINKIPMTTNQACANIQLDESVANYRYIFHFLLSQYEYIKSLGAGSQTNINAGIVRKLQIPIPCPDNPEKSLAIQAEIVRILDTFTALTAELTAELTDRKKQYNYYRDRLLTFEKGEVEWKTLGDVAIKISSGGTPKTEVSEYYDGDIPWLRTQEVDFGEIWDTGVKITEAGLKNSSAKWMPENCVILAMYGATVGKIGINKIAMTTNQACANIQLDENVANYRYVFHFLSGQYEYIKSLGTGSQTNINAGIVKKLQIPIPPLAEQARIVAILDKFDTLTTSISEGLPREIALRQKQYEYYRDLLLTFPKPEEVEA